MNNTWPDDQTNHTLISSEEKEEERKSLQKIITALRCYRKYAYARVNKRESFMCGLPQRHQHMLSKYRLHLDVLRDCIDVNQAVINEMLSPCADVTETDIGSRANGVHERASMRLNQQDMENPEHVDVEPFQILKAQSILKLIARDWSAEGAEERTHSYKPIVDAIEDYFKPDQYEISKIKILVPGAGLGRLSYDLACHGFACEGNEFSYFMLIASFFVINKCTEENMYTLYPWVHQYNNTLSMNDQTAPIKFPDICPAKNRPKGKLDMAAGDFLEVYKDSNYCHCVATCFFIDCANNIIDFIETIYHILTPGGIWVNLGPLLYHYSDLDGENSIEPTYENLVHIIEMVGFEFIKKDTGLRTKYAQNPRSMLKSEYESLFWVCRKPLTADNESATLNGVQLENEIDNRTYKNGFIKCGSNIADLNVNDEIVDNDAE